MKRILLLHLIFLMTLPVCFSQTFSSTVNQGIPDNNTVVSFPIVVSGLPSVIDSSFGLESACLNMTHTWCADMEVILQAPDGTQALLFSGVGGSGDDFLGTCLIDSGMSITAGNPPFNGNFKSQGPMGNINNGQNPNGTWLLLCRDMAGADLGFLQDWRITFGNNPAMPFIFGSSNLPIVKLRTLGTPIGNDPKVPVEIKVIDNGPGIRNYVSDTVYAFEGRIMAEWQGFSGPSYPKKNYDFEIVDLLGNEVDTVLLGMPSESDWILKAEYLDHSLVKNTITYEMARRMGGYAPRIRPCEVILDGQYIGYYSLTEKVKRGPFRLDIAKLTDTDTSGIELTGGYIFEMNINGDPADWVSVFPPINNNTSTFAVEFKHVYPKSSVILPVQHDYLVDYVDQFENVLNGPTYTDPQTGYRSLIDVETFIDFLIVNEFSVNYDSYGRSTYLYKEKDTDGGKLKIGPPWDYDRALDWAEPGRTSGWVWQITHPYWPFPFWWSRLNSDPDYRKQLACRWLMLRQETLSDSAFLHLIDSTTNQLSEAAGRNFTVWNDLGGESYQDKVDSLKSYLTRRLVWMDATLALENVAPPTFYLPTDTLFCYGSIYDAAFNGTQYSYNWQPGPDTSVVTWTQPGTYHLLVTDRHGCYARKAIEVSIARPSAAFVTQATPNPFAWNFLPDSLSGLTYAWDFGDGNNASSATPQHTYTATGIFPVVLTVTDANGCTAADSLALNVTGVFIEEEIVSLGELFPVPFEEKLNLKLDKPLSQTGTVSLINELGQVVLEKRFPKGEHALQLETDRLPAGIYTLKMASGQRIWTGKVMKR